MKKILSLSLAVMMVVSMIPTAFAADVDYKNGTEVEYTGTRSTVEDDGSVTHNAEYTITVPALLAPGGSGTVTLEGYWPSDATVKVTAEEKVEVVSDINSADKKELAVTFASIEKAGSNTAIVTASAPVSVANIENALFGKWAGKFNYNVEYNGAAGGSGTVTPTPDPEQPGDGEEATTITFTIDGTEYQALQRMTWGEWVESDYNTDGFVIATNVRNVNSDQLFNAVANADKNKVVRDSGTLQTSDKFIGAGDYLFHELNGEPWELVEPEANLITFTIDGEEYQAEEGMIWADWCSSKYNTYGITNQGKLYNIYNGEGLVLKHDGWMIVTGSEHIDPTIQYTFVAE